MRLALAGLAAYQQAQRPDRGAARPVVARAGRAMLRGFGGEGPPLVFVPSLINPPDVLDLAPGNSLLAWLSSRGFRPMLVDWGDPSPDERELSVAGHVEDLLVPMLAALGEPPLVAGYCLGGTMAIAASNLVPLRALALIATPWRFSGFSDSSREFLKALWTDGESLYDAIGLFPMEALQAGFWHLDPARTVSKFERFALLEPGSAEANAFVALEDWANGGPPLTYAAGRELLVDFFGNDIPGQGLWRVGGHACDPAAIPCPVLDIASTTDRIVPASSAPRAGDHRLLSQGHVGMIVGRQARSVLWEPLAEWLANPA